MDATFPPVVRMSETFAIVSTKRLKTFLAYGCVSLWKLDLLLDLQIHRSSSRSKSIRDPAQITFRKIQQRITGCQRDHKNTVKRSAWTEAIGFRSTKIYRMSQTCAATKTSNETTQRSTRQLKSNQFPPRSDAGPGVSK